MEPSTQGQVRTTAPTSAWAPLGHRAFSVLWLATVASNVGTWMHDVGAGWLMTELSPSPGMVAAVQAATTLPVFLFALLAGAVADIVDRRKLLIVVNIAMAIVAAALSGVVAAGLATPAVLLAFTVLLGTGAAFIAPAWQAIVPSLVPRPDLPAAIALNSAGINVSRAIGPALAGGLIVAVGVWAPFALNALSFIGIIVALAWWRPPPAPEPKASPEAVVAAVVAGLRYAADSRPLRATLVRAAAFFLFASALWAMLPLVARSLLGGGAPLYGWLVTAIGAGAVAGAFLLPLIKKKLGPDGTVVAGTFGVAAVLVTLAIVRNEGLAIAAVGLAGFSWIAVLSTLSVSAQTALPDWVRARGLSIYLTVFFGGMTAGSLLWGQVAEQAGIGTCLVVAAVGAIAMIPLTWRAKLEQGHDLDLAPSLHWPQPVLSSDLDRDRGPVSIHVVYRIAEADRATFLTTMAELAHARRRNGGYAWTLLEDAADPTRFVETWQEASWTQHLRHHDRVTNADRAIQDRIRALHQGDNAPTVTHYIDSRR